MYTHTHLNTISLSCLAPAHFSPHPSMPTESFSCPCSPQGIWAQRNQSWPLRMLLSSATPSYAQVTLDDSGPCRVLGIESQVGFMQGQSPLQCSCSGPSSTFYLGGAWVGGSWPRMGICRGTKQDKVGQGSAGQTSQRRWGRWVPQSPSVPCGLVRHPTCPLCLMHSHSSHGQPYP